MFMRHRPRQPITDNVDSVAATADVVVGGMLAVAAIVTVCF
jgi:hypothetical protein